MLEQQNLTVEAIGQLDPSGLVQLLKADREQLLSPELGPYIRECAMVRLSGNPLILQANIETLRHTLEQQDKELFLLVNTSLWSIVAQELTPLSIPKLLYAVFGLVGLYLLCRKNISDTDLTEITRPEYADFARNRVQQYTR